jgi:cytochrome P450
MNRAEAAAPPLPSAQSAARGYGAAPPASRVAIAIATPRAHRLALDPGVSTAPHRAAARAGAQAPPNRTALNTCYLRDEEPCYLHEFNDPILIDRAWVVSRNADIWAVDRNSELYAADRGYVNMWKVAVIDPRAGGKPAMLTMDGIKHGTQRGVMSKAFTPGGGQAARGQVPRVRRHIIDAALEKGTFNFAKDRGCTRPGCTVAGANCQVHHAVNDWADNGQTNIDDLALACPKDNRSITPGGWKTRKRQDGRTEWIPPPHLDSGQSRINDHHHPENYLVDEKDDEADDG